MRRVLRFEFELEFELRLGHTQLVLKSLLLFLLLLFNGVQADTTTFYYVFCFIRFYISFWQYKSARPLFN